MSNTISVIEADVNTLMLAYVGLQLERGPASNGPFVLLTQWPYVADQTSYSYADTSGSNGDWYRTARYTASGLGPYSDPWPVTPPQVSGVTLARIEQATARRVGPYYQLAMDRQTPTTANFERAYFPGLRSTIEQDLVTNLYALRRGVTFDGTSVAVSPDDRQRMVAVYEPATGAVTIDRPWSASPSPGEMVEFHHLNPEQELRPAVIAGLRRCYFEDRYSLGPGYVYEADLTQALPWLINPRWVWRAQQGPYPSSYGTPCDVPYTVFGQGGHVVIRLQTGWQGPYYGAVQLTLLHPVFNRVNGVDTVYGPLVDDDALDVDLEYAASAAHIEAWHLSPARLQAAAAGNLFPSREQTAIEFGRMAAIWAPRKPDLWQMPSRQGYGLTVVNA